MTKASQILLGLVIFGGATLTFLSPLVFSAPQQVPETEPPLGTPARQALARERQDAWLHKRISHPACPNCFTVEGEFSIHETVPGTDFIITRDLPDPAPLELGKVRDTVHPKTGEPLWYKGDQAFVGPTDEDPWSTSLPIPLIQLKRIRYRHDAELRKIDGVHAISIGEKGLLVEILPEKSASRQLIPSSVEGIPVVVEEIGAPIMVSHWFTYYRSVPVGAGIQSYLPTGGYGTLGPHVARDVSDIGVCCQLYTLTAGHVLQDMSLPMPTGRIIAQGGYPYGFFGFMFRLTPCTGQDYYTCLYFAGPVNDTRWVPDAAAIGHDTQDRYPMAPPCSGAEKPVRRMQHGVTSYQDGPSGNVRIPTMSSCSSNCLRTWRSYAHRAPGRLRSTEQFNAISFEVRPGSYKWFYMGPLDTYTSTTALQSGDSGALVAWDSSRDVIGMAIAAAYGNVGNFLYGVYERLDYVQMAFARAGVSFHHYWGTGSGKLNPSYTASDPLNPPPTSCSQ